MSHLAKDMTPQVTWKDIIPSGAIFEGGTSEAVETGDVGGTYRYLDLRE